MLINLENVGKQYNRQWIFRNFSFQFPHTGHFAITGANGSGKSTLLSIISAQTTPTEGIISFVENQQNISPDVVFDKFSLAAPSMELVEEFTLTEMLEFHFEFCAIVPNFDINAIISTLNLEASKHKLIKNFSSGMKQRVKLAQAFFTQKPVILLDEPCSNLDKEGIQLYQSLIEQQTQNKLCIVCSNQPFEYEFCSQIIDISRYSSI